MEALLLDALRAALEAGGETFLPALRDVATTPGGVDLLRSVRAGFPPARFYERRALELALFGCGSDDDLFAIVESNAAHPDVRGVRCRTLWLAERTVGTVPPNPWNLDASLALSEALRQVWEPMAAFGSASIELLQQEVLALALLETESSGWRLGYVSLWRLEEGEGKFAADFWAPRPPVDRAHCAEWACFAGLSVVLGAAPVQAQGPLAATELGALWRVHGSLHGGMAHLDAPETLTSVRALYELASDSEGSRSFLEQSGGLPPSDFLVLFGYGDDASELLAIRASGEPQLHWFAAQDWALGEGVPFSEWWPRRLAESFLKLPVDDED